MPVRLLSSPAELNAYAEWIASHPHGSLWQSLEWKTYQESLGRDVRIYAAFNGHEIEASALVTIDRTSFGLSVWDIPRGPLGPLGIENEKLKMKNLMEKIVEDAKKDKCLSIYLSPFKEIIFNFQFSIVRSPRFEQPEATRILDLTMSDDALLEQMHQKGRYNIKVAAKNGVTVSKSDDVTAYATLATQTAIRDGYKAASKRQYEMFLKHLPGSFLLTAQSSQRKAPIAGLIGVTWNKHAIYYYGASDHEHRALMAPYALQWAAIQHAKAEGCTSYDLLGIAPPDADDDHPWKGITSFKDKFGGALVTYPQEQRIVLKPVANAVLKMKRKLIV